MKSQGEANLAVTKPEPALKKERSTSPATGKKLVKGFSVRVELAKSLSSGASDLMGPQAAAPPVPEGEEDEKVDGSKQRAIHIFQEHGELGTCLDAWESLDSEWFAKDFCR